MKKLFFALACVIGLMTFAGCTQEQIDDIMAQKPTVEFVSGEGLISTNNSFYVDTELNFKVKIAPNAGSNQPLTNFDFSITNLNGNTVYNRKPEFNASAENILDFQFTPTEASTYTVTATVTDQAGKVNVATLVIDIAQPVIEGIGTFTGALNISGHVTTNEVVGYSYDDDYNMENLVTTITLGAIDDNNRVSATIEIDGTPVTLYGTMVNDVITFDEFHFNKSISITVDVTLDLIMNMTGILANDELVLSGTATGSGSATVLLVTVTANYTGDIEGTLTKVVEE